MHDLPKLTLSFCMIRLRYAPAQEARSLTGRLKLLTSITKRARAFNRIPQANVPEQIKCEAGWRCLKVKGPLEFPLIGVLASLATPLASAGVSIFALSTFNTDYLLVKENLLETALQVLSQEGHKIES